METKNKFYLTASIKLEEVTDAIQKEVASVINLPQGSDKQPDLSYFSAILVSTGTNLNNACFLGSELVAAKDTIISKAMDVEHVEDEIIGHIYSSAFTNSTGNKLNIAELASTETATLDTQDMHIQIGSVIYKSRFPELSKEIANDEWRVSMECFYTDYDVKVGDVILPKDAANAVGIDTANDKIFGQKGSIIKDGKEIATGTIERVLRGICFSGCGIVKTPANPPSVVLETASGTNEDGVIIFDITLKKEAAIEAQKEIINVTSKEIEGEQEISELTYKDSIGICVSYKKRVEDKEGNVVNENWCSEYSQACTSFSRDASDQSCLRNKVKSTTASYVETLLNSKRSQRLTANSLERLQSILDKAKKLVD